MYAIIFIFYFLKVYGSITTKVDSLRKQSILLSWRFRQASTPVEETNHTPIEHDTKSRSNLKVIGVGLPRTGTSSLTQALHDLGYGKCHHMSVDVVMDNFPYHKGRRWRQIFEEKDKTTRQAMIKDIFERGDFEATMDFPPCALADDLAEIFPDAKVSQHYQLYEIVQNMF